MIVASILDILFYKVSKVLPLLIFSVHQKEGHWIHYEMLNMRPVQAVIPEILYLQHVQILTSLISDDFDIHKNNKIYEPNEGRKHKINEISAGLSSWDDAETCCHDHHNWQANVDAPWEFYNIPISMTNLFSMTKKEKY